MSPDRHADPLAAAIAETIALHESVGRTGAHAVAAAADAIVAALGAGRTLLVFGNGGSAADAQHTAAELVWRFARSRRALAAIALTTDTSVLTAIGNDEAFERVFARQIEALGRPGDVALGITTSGASPNVVSALEVAKARGLTTIALTGRDGGRAGAVADIHVNVPAASTPRVQEVQRTLLHVICEIVERACADERDA